MSFAIQPQIKETRSASLTVDLSSNNPFRNRIPSPIPSPLDNAAPPRPVSRNPFLDASTSDKITFPTPPPNMSSTNGVSRPSRNPQSDVNTADLFDKMTLDDRTTQVMGPPSTRHRASHSRSQTDKSTPASAGRPENAGASENMKPRQPGHRPTRSQEEAMRMRRAAGPGARPRPGDELNIFADPAESSSRPGNRSRPSGSQRRPRRNSDTSIADRKPLDPEEEKRRQERRRRERKARAEREAAKDGKDGLDAKDGKPKKPDRKLDIIDQLDATSIYGAGLFHHDGPFDACNPHRNRTGSRRAPMQAFPKDSLNNVLGGSGPLNKRPDHKTFLGNNDEEAFKDYHKVNNVQAAPFQPISKDPVVESAASKVEPVHGEESMGLGTSTFLDGAPASRKAMARLESDTAVPQESGGGLQRKKSLAQKIRGINNRRELPSGGPMTSPEGVYSYGGSPDIITPNGTSRKAGEKNPFFNEYEPGKTDRVTIVEPPSRPGRSRATSSPRRGMTEGLQRRVTGDGLSSAAPATEEQKPMGFLSRVKSLKGGGRRPKERPVPAPGQAL